MGYEKMKTNRISPSNLKSVKDKLISTKCTAPLWERYHSGKIPIIPDIKSKSPGEGDLLRGRNPAVIAKSLQHAGAPVISVVTESEHYGGSLELLEQIVKATSVPILRKDFITTREQLLESAGAGANGVLLIASMLERKRLLKLIEQAITLDLEPLVETHNEAEIIAIKEFKLTFMGINNRNIIEWEMDNGNVNNTERLAGLVGQQVKTDYKNRLDCPPTLIVSESSIASQQDVLRAGVAGAHAVLVGTVILKAQDPVEMYYKLSDPERNIHDTR